MVKKLRNYLKIKNDSEAVILKAKPEGSLGLPPVYF
jgi:hypothetical protein